MSSKRNNKKQRKPKPFIAFDNGLKCPTAEISYCRMLGMYRVDTLLNFISYNPKHLRAMGDWFHDAAKWIEEKNRG